MGINKSKPLAQRLHDMDPRFNMDAPALDERILRDIANAVNEVMDMVLTQWYGEAPSQEVIDKSVRVNPAPGNVYSTQLIILNDDNKTYQVLGEVVWDIKGDSVHVVFNANKSK